ncbi:MAG TPA: tetratricopeptide repeat protein [Chromatiales bacterium]|nr:tetratricopeptide repeat protein [Chromatiales bacterium]
MNYHSEEEQVQVLKDWIKENGRAVIAGLVIGVTLIGGWRYWTSWQKTQAEQASLLYVEVMAAVVREEKDQASRLGQQMLETYPGTSYASLSAMLLAGLAAQQQEYPVATARLQWVLDNSGDEGFRQVARLRLARVLAAQDKPDEALALLDKTEVAAGFASLNQEVRGDVLAQKNQSMAAAEAYRKALADLGMDAQRRKSLERKLNSLPVPAPAGEAA